MVAAETRGRLAAQQAGNLPWIGVEDPLKMQRLQADHAGKMQKVSNFQLGGPKNSPQLAAHVVLCKKMWLGGLLLH